MWKAGLGTMLAVTTYAQADAGGITLAELPKHVTEGRVTIDATPAEIYELVTDYRAWRNVLSDIRSVEVEGGDREHARVRFRSQALRNTVTVQFNNEPGHTIRFVGIKGPPGGRARGEYHLIPVDHGARTQVVARIYMDVVGAPAIFVRDKTIRELRRA
ncbi:MAG TPA: SRPBCC family protein, partial [Kofleriaceae bacterium]